MRGQNLHGAWRRVQWDFSEDVDKAVERQIRHYLNKVLRIEADRRLRAGPCEGTLERLAYRAGRRHPLIITPEGGYEIEVPKGPIHASTFQRL